MKIMKKDDRMKKETIIAHLGDNRNEFKGAVVPPIFQNSLFTFESTEKIEHAFEHFTESSIYTRGNNPTVTILEAKLAALEHGEQAKCFTSGMAAISAALLHFLNSGDHIICIDSVYGPTSNFISEYLGKKFGITHTYVKGREINEFHMATRPETKVIYLESPSSGVFSIQDLKAVADYAKERGIVTIIDNTWATPIFQNPLDLGIDVVVHSLSKYICGHSDVVAGAVISSKNIIDAIFKDEHQLIGGKIAPFEAWLVLRGLRTLPVRMKAHQSNTEALIGFLSSRKEVKRIHYPGLSGFPGHEIAKSQMTGFSGLFSFELDTDSNGARQFIDHLTLFSIGVSWGGYESLVYAPNISLSKELSPEKLAAGGIHPGLIRISVGLESTDDLIRDIENALRYI